jgi:hypothetical protein
LKQFLRPRENEPKRNSLIKRRHGMGDSPRENTMTTSNTLTAGQPVLDRLLVNVFASDNWGALMRRYVSAAKRQPTTGNLNDGQLKELGLTRAKPEWTSKPRRYQGVL